MIFSAPASNIIKATIPEHISKYVDASLSWWSVETWALANKFATTLFFNRKSKIGGMQETFFHSPYQYMAKADRHMQMHDLIYCHSKGDLWSCFCPIIHSIPLCRTHFRGKIRKKGWCCSDSAILFEHTGRDEYTQLLNAHDHKSDFCPWKWLLNLHMFHILFQHKQL